MNNIDLQKDDILRQFLNSENLEKAPEGFTIKTMTRIRIDTTAVVPGRKFHIRSFVPVVSVLVISLLTIAALLIPSGQNSTSFLPVEGLLIQLEAMLPQMTFPPFDSLNVPGWLPYVFIGILMLAFFDKALSTIFHRK